MFRLLAAGAIGVLVLGTNPPASMRAADGAPTDTQLRAAQNRVLDGINAERSDAGLRAIRMDGRIRRVAEARSQDMVDRGYFSHQDPDGKWPWDHLNAAGITWYGAGEIIAWNMSSPLLASADTAVDQWMHSAGHKAQILSTSHNYAGVGVAVDDPRTFWTVVFIQGPDRTAPTASLTRASSAIGSRTIKLTWAGKDASLATLTAGLASYDLARRRPGGAWSTIKSTTTRTSLSFRAAKGTTYQFRIRARDKAGNMGDWSVVRGVTVR